MGLRTVVEVAAVRAAVAAWRAAGDKIAFVPTMGNLHAGHLSLAALAAQRAERVVVSIFVNPTQFGAGEDFGAYPRTLEDDTAALAGVGNVDLLFVPEVREIYPFGLEQAVRVTLPPLSRELCGASRPGHFDGVATVVCRLLNAVTPDVLVLGQKDYQQAVLMRRMIEDLRMAVTLQIGPTVRDADGLALSSRNRYLGPTERRIAPALHSALADARTELFAGDRDYAAIEARARVRLDGAGLRTDYIAVRRAADLAKPDADENGSELIVLGAAWLGRARLIDNVRV